MTHWELGIWLAAPVAAAAFVGAVMAYKYLGIRWARAGVDE